MNPILPLTEFVPDAEVRVFADGGVYVYGSLDLAGDTVYCSNRYNVYRTFDGMKTWEQKEIFSIDEGKFLYAPDCIEKDGKYYLYYCMHDGTEGMAQSEDPMGPFENIGIINGVEKDGIDPSVFVDDDGQAYYFWGQFDLRGAKMKADMCGIDEATANRALLTEADHGFHEGASLRKRNGIYYMLYTDIARGKATCISYATAKHPLGPYVKGGVIIDNTGCDPMSWNNHGSMAEIDGQWYVFYHRSTHNSKFSRRVCCEKLTFRADGAIEEVPMTSSGADSKLPLDTDIAFGRVSYIKGNGHVRTVQTLDGEEHVLTDTKKDTVVRMNYVNVTSCTHIAVCAAGIRGCSLDICADENGNTVLATIPLTSTGGFNRFETFSAPMKPSDTDTLWFLFRGSYGRFSDIASVNLSTK